MKLIEAVELLDEEIPAHLSGLGWDAWIMVRGTLALANALDKEEGKL